VLNDSLTKDKVSVAKGAVIHSGVDCARFSPGRSNRNVRARFGWGPEHLVLGTVANFRPVKRQRDLIDALVRLRRGFPNVRVLFVGRDQGSLPDIEKQVRLAGLSDLVGIIPGTEQPEEVYRDLDVYVSTSATEGFSSVILEAMASGKPVIATCVGGSTEAVREGETGFLVPPASPESIAARAEVLLASAELRRKMGQRARLVVESEFSVEHMVSQHEELYLRLARITTV
jgi:glycosyltransferase involved in cell wall biosynthesis